VLKPTKSLAVGRFWLHVPFIVPHFTSNNALIGWYCTQILLTSSLIAQSAEAYQIFGGLSLLVACSLHCAPFYQQHLPNQGPPVAIGVLAA
jgi:hypothetical protein